MKFNKILATAAMVIASMGVATGTAYADTAGPVSTQWKVDRHDSSVVVSTDTGSSSRPVTNSSSVTATGTMWGPSR